MRFYTAHLSTDAAPILVPEAFSLGALLFGPFWLAARGALLAAVLALIIEVLIWRLPGGPARLVLLGGVALLLGLFGHDLRRANLRRRGFVLCHVVAARNLGAAWQRLLDQHPELSGRL